MRKLSVHGSSARRDLVLVCALAACAIIPLLLIGAAHFAVQNALRDVVTVPPGLLSLGKWFVDTLFAPHPNADSWDVMRRAVDAFREHGEGIYERVFFGDGKKFQYPPASLLPFEFLESLGLRSNAQWNALNSIFFFLNAGALAWLAVGLSRREGFGPYERDNSRNVTVFGLGAGCLAFALPFVFQPTLQAALIGQIKVFIDLGFTLACIAWLAGRRASAGVCIGLLCATKPQFAVFLVWALLAREGRFAAALFLTGAAVGLAGLARYGLSDHLDYLKVLSFLSHHGESFYFNASVNGLMNRLLFNGCNVCFGASPIPPYNALVYAVTTATSLALLALVFWLAWRRPPGSIGLLGFSAAGVGLTLASPIAWDHHYGIALPAYIALMMHLLNQRPGTYRTYGLIVLALSWVLVAADMPVFNLLKDTSANVLQSYRLFGGLMLFGLLAVAARRETLARPRSEKVSGLSFSQMRPSTD